MANKEIFEREIERLERRINDQKATIEMLRERNVKLEKESEVKTIKTMRSLIVFLNSIYGQLGKIQGDLLLQLNNLNNDNLDMTSKTISEAMKVIQSLQPTNLIEVDPCG